MRILVAHNTYQLAGGEDSVVASEIALLREHGHEVSTFARDNKEIEGANPVGLAFDTLWSGRTTSDFRKLVESVRPDVLHVHNTFPLISPSIYWAADSLRIPVVQTLHNFRLLCPQAIFLRNGGICMDCVGHVPWRGALRACYRGSHAQSGLLAAMLVGHRAIGTWHKKISRFIVLNDFCRQIFVTGGLPADLLRIKPNFVEDCGEDAEAARQGFLFIGRLSEEKGVEVLVQASRLSPHRDISIAGSGPLMQRVTEQALADVLGPIPFDEVTARMRGAAALIVPSICLESFPRTIVEAFACSTPVIASRLGSLAEIVEDGVTGLLFEPGNATDLARQVEWARRNPQEMRRMGREARRRYEQLYTPERNYQILMDIYAEAIHAGTEKIQ